MMQQFIKQAYSTNQQSSAESNQSCRWETLSLPERNELTSAIKACNRKDGTEIAFLIANIGTKGVRDAALSLLCRKDYLIRRPENRGTLLESLLPFASESLVQAYAMMSLRDPLYSRSFTVCAPASRIIKAETEGRDTSINYELIDLAARLAPHHKDAAARIAFILLRESELTPPQHRLIMHNARVWYAEYRGTENPWFDIISQRKDLHAARFFKSVAEGDVSDPREHPVLANIISLPLLPHEIAVTASILTIAAQRIGRLFGQNNNLAATTGALAATTLIIGARYMWRASRLDKLNQHRDVERIEAIACLGGLLHERGRDSAPQNLKVQRWIRKVLSDNGQRVLQSPAVQEASRLALEGFTCKTELAQRATRNG